MKSILLCVDIFRFIKLKSLVFCRIRSVFKERRHSGLVSRANILKNSHTKLDSLLIQYIVNVRKDVFALILQFDIFLESNPYNVGVCFNFLRKASLKMMYKKHSFYSLQQIDRIFSIKPSILNIIRTGNPFNLKRSYFSQKKKMKNHTIIKSNIPPLGSHIKNNSQTLVLICKYNLYRNQRGTHRRRRFGSHTYTQSPASLAKINFPCINMKSPAFTRVAFAFSLRQRNMSPSTGQTD